VALLTSVQALLFDIAKTELNGIIAIRDTTFHLCNEARPSLDDSYRRHNACVIDYLGHAHFCA
jgi:hypothetical protein